MPLRVDADRSRFLDALAPEAMLEVARNLAISDGRPEWKWVGQGVTARGFSIPSSGQSLPCAYSMIGLYLQIGLRPGSAPSSCIVDWESIRHVPAKFMGPRVGEGLGYKSYERIVKRIIRDYKGPRGQDAGD